VCFIILFPPKAAQSFGREDRRHLLESQKLVLLVDLDQTLVHTTNARVPKYMKVRILCFILILYSYIF